MGEIPGDVEITMGRRVWIIRCGEFPTVEAARRVYKQIEAALPPGIGAIYVSGPPTVAPADPVAVREDEADPKS